MARRIAFAWTTWCTGLTSFATFAFEIKSIRVKPVRPNRSIGFWSSLSAAEPYRDDYLDRLTRYSDDGYTLSAPTRYSVADWAKNLAQMPRSTTLRRVRSHLLFNFAWASLVSFVYYILPSGWGATSNLFMPFNLSGGILGILLAFRTAQSYDRFWHGRKLWAKVINRTRGLARLSASYVTTGNEVDGAGHATLLRWLVAFPVALKQHLRGEREIGDFDSLEEYERRSLEACDHLPYACCYALSAQIDNIRRARETDQAAHALLWWQMEAHIEDLQNCIGETEAIAGTPVPLSYSRHTSRLLSLWALAMPFVLVTALPLLAVPIATSLVSWMLLATEEIGHLIEEPFGIHDNRPQVLPLDRYCSIIKRDLKEDNEFIRIAARTKFEAPPVSPAPHNDAPPSPIAELYGPPVLRDDKVDAECQQGDDSPSTSLPMTQPIRLLRSTVRH